MRWRIEAFFRQLRLRFFPPKPLLSKDEHLKLLEKARRLEAIQDEACKLLKCTPNELNSRAEKLLASIADLEQQIETFNKNKPEVGG